MHFYQLEIVAARRRFGAGSVIPLNVTGLGGGGRNDDQEESRNEAEMAPWSRRNHCWRQLMVITEREKKGFAWNEEISAFCATEEDGKWCE